MMTYAELMKRIEPTGESRDVFDPATEELVGRAPVQTSADVDAAVARARAAQPEWGAKSHEERSALLVRCAEALTENAEALAELLSREQGKPLNGLNARFELDACSGWLQATAALEIKPEVVIDDGTEYAELHYRPLGVVEAMSARRWCPTRTSTRSCSPGPPRLARRSSGPLRTP